MTSLWRHLWPNYDTLDFKILTQCVKMLGERVLQVWWWYLHWFRRYRKKTRGGLEIAPQWGAGYKSMGEQVSLVLRVWSYVVSSRNFSRVSCLYYSINCFSFPRPIFRLSPLIHMYVQHYVNKINCHWLSIRYFKTPQVGRLNIPVM